MSHAPVSRCALLMLAASLLPMSSLPAQTPGPTSAGASANPTVERALSSRVTLSLSDVTVQELAAQLRTRFHINVMIDRRSLDDVGLGSDSRLSGIECSEVILENALELLLDQVELSFYVRSDILVLTTPEEAENHLETVVYPVADLVVTRGGDPFEQHVEHLDFDTLIETITSVVDPDTWDEVGGAGAIEAFPSSRALVISQVRSVHRGVDALFASLRQARILQHLEYRAVGAGTMGPAGQPRRNMIQRVAPRELYQPNGAWSMPPKHD